ncbi:MULTISPECIES: HD domain-containing protein [Fusobacterium]|jgi:hypothetical protein|uniref:HD domain-containing protein n=1 Tax=Fusobacterium mortiferum ATCC 9817 TaxID=469616 RepID=A0ABN5JBG2_FUSMR|nr:MULTISPECIES: HD domain-containing protein [Fusobacterium]AVQ17778.1 HD domain-containing protein [Fusobacterium mortiferum ATCC 9817]EEO36534.1 hypothetical protein FMAG_02096 [Fusobacterium mortiferum ATCC 9817]MCF2626896.1 HD domain-containing protein [Fusobacterium mortiferum]MCI7664862.1 HD domain-containing protein [Fusobacterium mortiferum]MDY2799784.1 HD domain-containing protein [Fusobacterium mortiferum]
MLARIKQGLTFIFGKYKSEWNIEVKKILTDKEFEVFNQMSEYDKIHSYKILKLVLEDNLLKDEEIFKKLALLHDCGKYHASLYRRMKKVLIGEKTLDRHNEDSYKKLENINLELAELAKDHHYYSDDIYMQRFQELDDK